MKTRALFLGVVTPLGVLGRPLWKRRLGLTSSGATSYWRTRGDTITADALKRR